MNHTGISSSCATCHNGQAFQGVTPVSKPSGHIATTADCSTCHTSFTSFLGATFNHAGVTTGTCNTCHNGTYLGVMAETAVSNHIPTGALSCDTCHKSTAVGGFATFTPLGTSGHNALGVASLSANCMTCHTGVYFGVKKFTPHPGRNGATAATANFCGTCHKSTGFNVAPGGG
jgi:hypothetical protein